MAVQFGLVAFDIWNGFLDLCTGGVTMQNISPGATEKGKWVATSYADFLYSIPGWPTSARSVLMTGRLVRKILDSVVAELRKIEKDFDAARLKKKEGEKP